MRTFKKYKNRKIYSPETNSYTNLKAILSLVKDGESVQVIEHSSGRDITSKTLREAIMRFSELPTDKLVDMVRGEV